MNCTSSLTQPFSNATPDARAEAVRNSLRLTPFLQFAGAQQILSSVMAGQAIGARLHFLVAIETEAHIGRVDHAAGHCHRGNITVAFFAIDPCPEMGFVAEMYHGGCGHDVDLAPHQRYFVGVMIENLPDLRMIGNDAEMTTGAGRQSGDPGPIGNGRPGMALQALDLLFRVPGMVEGDRLRRGRRTGTGPAGGRQ